MRIHWIPYYLPLVGGLWLLYNVSDNQPDFDRMPMSFVLQIVMTVNLLLLLPLILAASWAVDLYRWAKRPFQKKEEP